MTYLGWTTLTYPFNLSGGAALTVPCGLADGLPVGLQIVGRRFADELVLRLGAAYEASVGPFSVPEPSERRRVALRRRSAIRATSRPIATPEQDADQHQDDQRRLGVERDERHLHPARSSRR